MSERPPPSLFSPPRAGRMAGFWRAWFNARRFLVTAFGGYRPSNDIRHSDWMPFAVVCMPLYGLRFSPNRLLRLLMPAIFVVALLLAIVGYGEEFSALAFGLVISMHAAAIGAYVQAVAPASSPLRRLGRQLGIALACMALGVFLIPRLISTVVIRVPTVRGLVLINPFSGSAPYQDGEPMAFLIQSYRGGFDLSGAGQVPDEERKPDFWQVNISVEPHALVRTGLYLGHVIAVPGERVTFTNGFFRVNDGVPRPALPLMPGQGELKVPAARVLVWPGDEPGSTAGRRGAYTLPPEALLLRKSALVGRPYKRWFWRSLPAAAESL